MKKTSTNVEPTTTTQTISDDKQEYLTKGIDVFTKNQERLTNAIARTNKAIDDIRQAYGKDGVIVPELEQAVKDVNKLSLIKARIDRGMVEVVDEKNPVDKRIAVLSVMIELVQSIDNKG